MPLTGVGGGDGLAGRAGSQGCRSSRRKSDPPLLARSCLHGRRCSSRFRCRQHVLDKTCSCCPVPILYLTIIKVIPIILIIIITFFSVIIDIRVFHFRRCWLLSGGRRTQFLKKNSHTPILMNAYYFVPTFMFIITGTTAINIM